MLTIASQVKSMFFQLEVADRKVREVTSLSDRLKHDIDNVQKERESLKLEGESQKTFMLHKMETEKQTIQQYVED